MGAATATTNGDASPVDLPGRRLYTNGDVEEKNGASHQAKHQHTSSDDDDVPDDDDSIHMAPSMLIMDVEFNSGTLQGLSKLRKNRQFCDVILQVEYVFESPFVYKTWSPILFSWSVYLAFVGLVHVPGCFYRLSVC